ncbi:MAG: right-handed parallel beta-helix repeat-containing protein, partial [Anaerolineales bacterium]|nr:right-handed parallel beta-helix repeat-containing protein [Anaerolineales bacterium]
MFVSLFLALQGNRAVAAPVAPAVPEENFVLLHPVFFNQPGIFDSYLYVFNTEDFTNTVTVQFNNGTVVTNTMPSLGLWVLPAADVSPALPASTAVIVSGTDPLETIVKTVYNGQKIAIYNGIENDEKDTELYFAPFNPDNNSQVVLFNPDVSTATVAPTFYDSNGASFVCNAMNIPPGATAVVNSACLPGGFLGSLIVTSDLPLVGLMTRVDAGLDEPRHDTAVTGSYISSSIEQYAPRFAEQWQLGDSLWQSDFLLMNASPMTTSISYAYYNGFGSVIDSGGTSDIPAKGFVYESNNLPAGSLVGGTAMASDIFLLADDLTISTPDNRTYASYRLDEASTLSVPYLFNDSAFGSYLSVQNLNFSPMNVAIDYHDMAGNLVYTYSFFVESYASYTVDIEEDIVLGDDFIGTAVVQTDGLATAVVDILAKKPPTCFATPDDGQTIYNNLQDALQAAPSGTTVKVAGICDDTAYYDGANSSVFHLDREMTIIGGYDGFNWDTSDPSQFPTLLDAKGNGQVARISDCVECFKPNTAPLAPNSIAVTVTLKNINLDFGSATLGGGLYVGETYKAVLDNVIISNSTAEYGGGIYIEQFAAADLRNNTIIANNTANIQGGGIYNYGQLATQNSYIIDNNVTGGHGGGLYNDIDAYADIADSQLTGNVASDNGAGLYGYSAQINITNSNIMDNIADQNGGGVALVAGAGLTMTHTAVVNNQATNGAGAGIFTEDSTANLTNSTVSQNIATSVGGGIAFRSNSLLNLESTSIVSNTASYGGGLGDPDLFLTRANRPAEASALQSGTVNIHNTLIANNNAISVGDDCYGTLNSLDYNLIGDDNAACVLAGQTTHTQVGVVAGLDPLQFAGFTFLHPLQNNSPAIDAGDPDACPALDQSFYAREDGLCDIGAYEARTSSPTTCYATPDDGATVYQKLQDAIDNTASGGTVKIAGYCSGLTTDSMGTNTVAYITDAITLEGGYTTTNWLVPLPLQNVTTLDADENGRVVVAEISGGGGRFLPAAPVNDVPVTLRNLVLTNGYSTSGDGGGIFATAVNLTLDTVLVQNNTTSSYGGGLYIDSTTTVTVTNSTFRDNYASADGGAIEGFGYLAVRDSKFMNNTANSNGGAIALNVSDPEQLRLQRVYFTGNVASTGYGGALWVHGVGTAVVSNSTFETNTAPAGGAIYNGDGTTTGD